MKLRSKAFMDIPRTLSRKSLLFIISKLHMSKLTTVFDDARVDTAA